jgi:hypothetical protein
MVFVNPGENELGKYLNFNGMFVDRQSFYCRFWGWNIETDEVTDRFDCELK